MTSVLIFDWLTITHVALLTGCGGEDATVDECNTLYALLKSNTYLEISPIILKISLNELEIYLNGLEISPMHVDYIL